MQKITGVALLLLGGLMALGFTQASLSQGAGVIFLSFCLTVLLPLAGGVGLLRSSLKQGNRRQVGKSALAQKTLQAEILKLAAQHQGRLTVLEVTQAFVVTHEEAEQALDKMALERLAEHQLTDDGLLVYTFPEVQQLQHKHQAKDIGDF